MHTKGPWTFTLGSPKNRLNPIVYNADGMIAIARLFYVDSTVAGMISNGPTTLEEAEANARLADEIKRCC